MLSASGNQAAAAQGAEPTSGPGRILAAVFETLDDAGIRYCVLHGYEGYPQRVNSDVDCVIDPATSPEALCALLHHNRIRIGAEIVHPRGYHLILAGKHADGSPCFLALDMTVDCRVDDLPFQAGPEVLANRRRHRQFWIPAADLAFGCYLVRTIAKGRLDDERARRLSALYNEDAGGSAQQVARFWGTHSAELIVSAARSGDWQPVRRDLGALRAELRRRALLRRPGTFARNKSRAVVERIGRVCRPNGLNVVLLGPDGAGKSSVIEALGTKVAGAFARSTCSGFAPPLHRLFRRGTPSSTSQPHGLPARSLPTSLARAGYWWIYHTFRYLSLRRALARSTLVLNDRHFVDVLVDAKRYRYGGPSWLLRLIWRVIPKPDLVILLDAPAEVLQARKQEVLFEETARQRRAYLSLVRNLENGHVVDAAQPLGTVADNVGEIILRHLTLRIARRLGLERNMRPNAREMVATQGPFGTRTKEVERQPS
jgi:thymidylate kinase